jgi:type I restriction enzyme S subunit
MSAYQGALGIAGQFGAISPDYMVLRFRTAVEPRFAGYLFKSSYMNGEMSSRVKGIGSIDSGSVRTPRLSWSELSEVSIDVPDIAEQKAIAEYLDRETAQIDNLIAKQEQLITTLGERRKAKIAQLLTSDQTRDGDSLVAPIKRFFTNLDSRRIPLSAEERGSRQGEFPYYGASGIIDYVDDFLFDDDLVLVAEDGANLVNRSTPVSYSVNGKIWVNNHAHILKPTDGLSAFWAARLETLDFFPWVSGSAQPKLTSEALMNIEVSAPSNMEVRARLGAEIIANDRQTNDLLAVAKKLTTTLRERRQALISAAVTGKIEVAA